MTRDQAIAVQVIFRSIGGFSEVRLAVVGGEFGDQNSCQVELWSVNARAGNRNLTVVCDVVAEKEAKLIAKQAKGKASERDKAALSRIAAARAEERS